MWIARSTTPPPSSGEEDWGCPEFIEILSKPEVIGQTVDLEIQSLSRHRPIEHLRKDFSDLGYILDKPWICQLAHRPPIDRLWHAWTMFGQRLDLDKLWTNTGLANLSVSRTLTARGFLDKDWTNCWIWTHWTNTGLVNLSISHTLTTCGFLDRDWTKFGLGQTLDNPCICHLKHCPCPAIDL